MNKKQTTFTIGNEVLSNLDLYCKSKSMNKSQFVENAIQSFIESERIGENLDDEHKKICILQNRLDAFRSMGTFVNNDGKAMFPTDWCLRNILKFSDDEIKSIKEQE